jgi:predicted GTPase
LSGGKRKILKQKVEKNMSAKSDSKRAIKSIINMAIDARRKENKADTVFLKMIYNTEKGCLLTAAKSAALSLGLCR